MKPIHSSFKITVALLFSSQLTFAATDESPNYLLYSLVGIGIVILIYAILSILDTMMQVEAKNVGADTSDNKYGIVPTLTSLFKPKVGALVDPKTTIFLNKGHDIKIVGGADVSNTIANTAKHYAVKPTNFRGMAPIPKVAVAEGDHVKAGDALIFDKSTPEVKYCAPVSGEVIEIRRGAKRSITDVIIKADNDISFKDNSVPDIENADRDKIISFLQESGGWAHLNQRPFDIIPDAAVAPKNIFISTFDTAPNAPDLNILAEGNEAAFQKGLDVLNTLTDGTVYVGLDGRKGYTSHPAYRNATGVTTQYFTGKHPAGNVGIQIHHKAPINTGDVVWTAKVQDVIVIGRLFLTGAYDTRTKIALTGAEIENGYVDTFLGASVHELVVPNLKSEHIRVISGNVLNGDVVPVDGYLDQKTNQVTILKEGDEHEMFGWLLPLKPRPSVSPTFPTYLMPNLKFDVDTNTHGEQRAFVVTGAYEKVLPMDIYPQHLMKAIMANDFENMEGLGILELSEEDLALCEFVCASKAPLQSILRDGLETMRDQM